MLGGRHRISSRSSPSPWVLICRCPGHRHVWRHPGSVFHQLRSDRCAFLVLGVRFEHEFTNAVLGARVDDGTQQREAATLTIDRVRACRERNVAPVATTFFPDGEADELQAFELSLGEMQLGIREFAGWIAAIVRCDSYDHDLTS